MTPKEYAKFIFLQHLETLKPLGIIGSPAKKTAKRNLVITVNELIIQNEESYLNGLYGIYYREKYNFLFEVIQEIELL